MFEQVKTRYEQIQNIVGQASNMFNDRKVEKKCMPEDL